MLSGLNIIKLHYYFVNCTILSYLSFSKYNYLIVIEQLSYFTKKGIQSVVYNILGFIGLSPIYGRRIDERHEFASNCPIRKTAFQQTPKRSSDSEQQGPSKAQLGVHRIFIMEVREFSIANVSTDRGMRTDTRYYVLS
jgi:hypothetical protein